METTGNHFLKTSKYYRIYLKLKKICEHTFVFYHLGTEEQPWALTLDSTLSMFGQNISLIGKSFLIYFWTK